jgi:hypothetical protein
LGTDIVIGVAFNCGKNQREGQIQEGERGRCLRERRLPFDCLKLCRGRQASERARQKKIACLAAPAGHLELFVRSAKNQFMRRFVCAFQHTTPIFVYCGVLFLFMRCSLVYASFLVCLLHPWRQVLCTKTHLEGTHGHLAEMANSAAKRGPSQVRIQKFHRLPMICFNESANRWLFEDREQFFLIYTRNQDGRCNKSARGCPSWSQRARRVDLPRRCWPGQVRIF